MCLPSGWDEPLVDAATGRSVLPASLLTLALGDSCHHPSVKRGALGESWRHLSVVHAPFDRGEGKEVREEAEWVSGYDYGEDEFDRRFTYVHSGRWGGAQYGASRAKFSQPIPAGALPRGLRFLQYSLCPSLALPH